MASAPQDVTKFKQVSLRGTKITEHLLLNNTVFDGDFDANFLQVGGNLSIIGTTFIGKFNAPSTIINGDFAMSRARLKEVNLNHTNVKGSVIAEGSAIDGPFDAISLQVGGEFIIGADANKPATFKSMNLNNVKINGDFRIEAASVSETVVATMLRVGGNLYMGSVTEDLNERAGKVGGTPFQSRLAANFKRSFFTALRWKEMFLCLGPFLRMSSEFPLYASVAVCICATRSV